MELEISIIITGLIVIGILVTPIFESNGLINDFSDIPQTNEWITPTGPWGNATGISDVKTIVDHEDNVHLFWKGHYENQQIVVFKHCWYIEGAFVEINNLSIFRDYYPPSLGSNNYPYRLIPNEGTEIFLVMTEPNGFGIFLLSENGFQNIMVDFFFPENFDVVLYEGTFHFAFTEENELFYITYDDSGWGPLQKISTYVGEPNKYSPIGEPQIAISDRGEILVLCTFYGFNEAEIPINIDLNYFSKSVTADNWKNNTISPTPGFDYLGNFDLIQDETDKIHLFYSLENENFESYLYHQTFKESNFIIEDTTKLFDFDLSESDYFILNSINTAIIGSDIFCLCSVMESLADTSFDNDLFLFHKNDNSNWAKTQIDTDEPNYISHCSIVGDSLGRLFISYLYSSFYESPLYITNAKFSYNLEAFAYNPSNISSLQVWIYPFALITLIILFKYRKLKQPI
jgi:hypothetical protein